MASWQAHVLRFLVRRRIGPRLRDMSDVLQVRKVFGESQQPPRGARFTPATLGGVRGEWVEAAAAPARPAPLLLYVHGGGFVGCTPETHRPITAGFALRGFRVFVPDYRLAPEFPFPGPLDDVVAAWRGLRAAAAPGERLVLAGDSAGGNLALGLMLTLRDAGEALPDAAALFSPSTDLTGESPSLLANTGRDPMFHGPALEHLARAYLGAAGEPGHPLVSPLQAELAGLPPLLVHVGEDEVLRDDALRLAQKARAAGVRVEAVAWAVVPHCWQMVPQVPEARRSMDAAAAFLASAGARRDEPEHLDAVIIGAGLSGIGMAAQLQARCPGRRYALLEARDAIGGTWDLFRYPGVRSDSDMHTLGYGFKPWRGDKVMADGPAIRDYIRETAFERGIDRQVRFGHRVVRADWSPADACWTLEVEHAGERRRLRCDFLLACSGYYRYDAGYRPEFAGEADYRGRLVHPQAWPEDLDYAGKRVVVIGSGATAVTLVPEMAKTAAHVTMLQRSPSYVLALPSRDAIAAVAKRVLPQRLAYGLVRTKNMLAALLLFKAARRFPQRMRALLVGLARRALGPGHDVDTHFNPAYAPWDQRLCFVPDGDLFKALASGRAEVVTDRIDRFTERGLRLASGRELEADVVVTATGLSLNLLGDVAVSVAGVPRALSQAVSYKALMLSGIPNLVYTFGYTNASWTLKADLTARWTCRLLNTMEARGVRIATPQLPPGLALRPFFELTSGYVQRAAAILPRQGATGPWRLTQDYLRDWATLRLGRIADGTLALTNPPAPGTADVRGVPA
jgi:cation diffusion facilitator CzcD-associated flavoprotein CzcO/acetyl esterase/lipase